MTVRRREGGECPPATPSRFFRTRRDGKATPAPRIRSVGYASLRSEPSNFPRSTRPDRPGALRLSSAPSGLPQTCKTPAWGSFAVAAGEQPAFGARLPLDSRRSQSDSNRKAPGGRSPLRTSVRGTASRPSNPPASSAIDSVTPVIRSGLAIRHPSRTASSPRDRRG